MPQTIRRDQRTRFEAISERAIRRRPAVGKLWLLEDSPLQAAQTMAQLGEYGIEHFVDGGSLLERLAVAEPDVLVLDLEVPDMSGLEVLRFVRQTHDEVSLPVLILTTSQTDGIASQALAAGANDFVTKPCDDLVLRARVATLFRIHALYDRARVAEQERTDALERAKEAEKELAEEAAFRELFIAILGHDLRMPLSALTLVGHLLTTSSAEELRKLDPGRRIQSSAERMSRMIADLLDFTRSRKGGIPVVRRPAVLEEIVRGVVQEIQLAHPDRTILIDAAGDTSGSWDADRLQQIVSNLVMNAIDYSPPSQPVRVGIRTGEHNVELHVHNGGVPIPSAVLGTLFDPFRRAATEGTGRSASRGLGLGLYIVAEITRAHQGTVTVRSEADEGTTFSVSLPRDVAHAGD